MNWELQVIKLKEHPQDGINQIKKFLKKEKEFMKEKDEIIMLPTTSISAHPMNKVLYGEIVLEEEFVASIKDRGVLQPILVTPDIVGGMDMDRYVCISGHRRHAGSMRAGLEEIPGIIKKYENPDEAVLDLIFSNFGREKTNEQRKAEFFTIKQNLSQFGKLHQGKGIYGSTIFINEEFSRILISYDIDPEEPLDSMTILKLTSGYTEHEQRMLNIISDPVYREKKLNKLRKLGVKEDVIKEINAFWAKSEKSYDKDKNSLFAVASAIKKELDAIEEKMTKGRKPKKEPKQKEEKFVEAEFDGEAVLMPKKIEKPMKLVPFGDTRDCEYGFIRNMNALNTESNGYTGMYLAKGKKVFEINLAELSKLLD